MPNATQIPADRELRYDDSIATRLVFTLSFFAKEAVSELGLPLLDTFTRYRDIVGEDALRFYATANMSKHRKVTKRALAMLETWLQPGAALDDYVFISFEDAEAYNDAPSSLFLLAGAEEVDGERVEDATLVRISLPIDFAIEDPAQMQSFAEEIWSTVPFQSGQAGFGLECSRYFLDEAHEHAYAKSMRHRGLDIPDAVNDATNSGHDHLRGIGWLTFLDDDFTMRLDGAEAIASNVDAEVSVTKPARGVVLRAGDRPAFGDVNRKDDLPEYESVFAAVRPLLVDPSDTPALNLSGDYTGRTEAWLTRFDP